MRFLIFAFALLGTKLYAADGAFDIDRNLASLLREESYEEAQSYADSHGITDPFFRSWLRFKCGDAVGALGDLRRAIRGDHLVEDAVRAVQIVADVDSQQALDFAHKLEENNEELANAPDFVTEIMMLNVRLQKIEAAEAVAAKLVGLRQTSDRFHDAIFALLIHYQQSGNALKATEMLELIFQNFPQHSLAPGHILQGIHIKNLSGKYLEALEELDRLKGSYPEYFEANQAIFALAKGLAFRGLGESSKAEAYLGSVEELAGDNPSFSGHVALAKQLITSSKRTRELRENKLNSSTEKTISSSSILLKYVFLAISSLISVGIFVFFFYRKTPNGSDEK